jgi:hypothetical protein
VKVFAVGAARADSTVRDEVFGCRARDTFATYVGFLLH